MQSSSIFCYECWEQTFLHTNSLGIYPSHFLLKIFTLPTQTQGIREELSHWELNAVL